MRTLNSFALKVFALLSAVLVSVGTVSMAASSVANVLTVESYAEGEEGEFDTEKGNELDGDLGTVMGKVEDAGNDVKSIIVKVSNIAFVIALGFILITVIFEHDSKALKTKISAALIVCAAIFVLRLTVGGTIMNIINNLASTTNGG